MLTLSFTSPLCIAVEPLLGNCFEWSSRLDFKLFTPSKMLRSSLICVVFIAAEATALSQSIPRGISRHYGGAGLPTPIGHSQDASAASRSATELRIPSFLARHYAGKDASIQNSSNTISNLGPIVDTVAPNDWLLQAKATDFRRAPALHANAVKSREPGPKTPVPRSPERTVARPVIEGGANILIGNVALEDAAESYTLGSIELETNLTRAQVFF